MKVARDAAAVEEVADLAVDSEVTEEEEAASKAKNSPEVVEEALEAVVVVEDPVAAPLRMVLLPSRLPLPMLVPKPPLTEYF